MASLLVAITGCEVKKGKGRYFVMCQLDQISNSQAKIEGDKITAKKKTDIAETSEFPTFSVNTLVFEDVVIFCDLSLKLGLFELVARNVLDLSHSLPIDSARIDRDQQVRHNAPNDSYPVPRPVGQGVAPANFSRFASPSNTLL